MEENSELLMKYQKLAHEYSKLKAQTSVLKTAVADEQTTASELQEALKKKDQFIRKLEQEVECLNFRNLQLTKRVSILQNDLEGVDANPKHSKNKHVSNHSSPLPDSYDVLNLELKSRIEENEKLHKQVYAAELEHKKEVTELTSTIEKLQNDLADQERKLNSKIEEQDSLINILQKEKIKMQVTLKNYEKELKNHKKEEEIKEKDNISLQEDLQVQLEEAKTVIADKILFNDTGFDSLNNLNVPVLQRGKHQQLCSLMLNMNGLVSDFCRQLSDLYMFMIQRLCSTTSDSSLKEVNTRLETVFRDSISHVKIIPTNFEAITSAIKNESLAWDKSPVLEFSVAFQKYVIYLDKLMPYLILRIQNKESWISSSSKSIELIPKLISLCKKLMNCFKSLSSYLELLQTVGSQKKMYMVKQSVIVQKIHSSLEVLQQSFDETRKLFGSKVALDHQLPIISQDDKNTDECILSTLVSLSSTLKKFTEMMTKDMDMISCDIWYIPRKCSKLRNGTLNPYVWEFKNRGLKYFQRISQPEFELPSIPYEVALENDKKLRDHSENQENLTQQLEHYQNKLMQLELDKEKWMLECTLMKAKSSNSDGVSGGVEITAQGYDEIHQFVQTTVNQLIQQIQFADSKFIAYRNECETLYQKLKMCNQRKENLENEIANSRQIIERLKDEQKTLMVSYEDQLNTMSEHLANLNEKLTAQKDEIDALKQTGGKGSKKGKSR